jgi:hypothetical protein
MKQWFYEKNTYLLEHSVNKTFDEILLMSRDEFRNWCKELREVVVYSWDELGIPPRVGYNEQEIIQQFKNISLFPVHKMLIKDDISKKKDVIRNTNVLGNSVNQFFPSMMKTRINYSDDSESGRSIYDFFSLDELFDRFCTYAYRHFKRDSFYHYSVPVKANDKDQYNNYPISDNGIDWILKFEKDYRNRDKYDYWLSPVDSDKSYTGYNEDIKSRKFLSITDADILTLGQNIPLHCQTNIDYKDTNHYQIRAYEKGQKLFPIGLKAFRVSFCQYATNFPPLVAKFIYEKFTEEYKNRDTIHVWDPSSGWGGRLLGALSVKHDRHITYLGNDPNTDHNTYDGRNKYHEIYDFYVNTVDKGGLFPEPHTDFKFWQSGSEVMQYDEEFQKYKGKLSLVFTSPPYFCKEAYSEDLEQSYKKFDTYDVWKKEFLYETLKTAYEWLEKDGYLVWNISDVKIGKNILPLVDDSVEICEKLGFKRLDDLKLSLAQMPGSGRIDSETGLPKTKYYYQTNGMFLKYEPILCFRKI